MMVLLGYDNLLLFWQPFCVCYWSVIFVIKHLNISSVFFFFFRFLICWYSQLSISRVQFCSSSGYLLRSIMHAAVVVILWGNRTRGHREHTMFIKSTSETRKKLFNDFIVPPPPLLSNARRDSDSWWYETKNPGWTTTIHWLTTRGPGQNTSSSCLISVNKCSGLRRSLREHSCLSDQERSSSVLSLPPVSPW